MTMRILTGAVAVQHPCLAVMARDCASVGLPQRIDIAMVFLSCRRLVARPHRARRWPYLASTAPMATASAPVEALHMPGAVIRAVPFVSASGAASQRIVVGSC